VAGGYLEVKDDQVTVLVDVVERPAEIDKARAEKAKQRALERMGKAEIDSIRAQQALQRANQRLALAAVIGRQA
jgi:F-type H+-transporting ATPase subunit epsilon